MNVLGDDDFDGLVNLVREYQVAAIVKAKACASGPDCDRCYSIRMRYAETAAFIKATQEDLAHLMRQSSASETGE